ncbi:rhomboid family intramembrane serine protease [Aliikangiella sp. G2MR2-5]|uniref:rhomboid family intramembrane serine protease n=1 Tax=Aliikangiella sp. G2MR2-5 TaxID=2788943 RepID=UPI0018AC5F62|nr:rhomboid family intramembrane serine protease [Aliikangiella sp. G2MR2-5]
MIIVPTEKRFDWKHTPISLFSIVLLNVLVYFFYQSGDNELFLQAVESYSEENYFEQEWPAYLDYLKKEGKDSELLDAEEAHSHGYQQELMVNLLIDQNFYQYLKVNARKYINSREYFDWKRKRNEIDKIIGEVSFIKYGIVPSNFRLIQVLTHMFLHGDVMHLLGNMFFLVLCGFAVEASIGHRQFLGFYLLSGFAACLPDLLLTPNSSTPSIGASGAISGVMAMYLAIFKLRKIEFFYWFFIFIGYIRLPALVILPFYIAKEIADSLANPDSNVNFMAHAGGFIAGAIIIFTYQIINPDGINEDYLDAEPDDDPQREKLAKYYDLVEKYQFGSALKLLDEVIKQKGPDFDLLMLRYNLLKLAPGKSLYQTISSLVSVSQLPAGGVEKLETIWQENEKAHRYIKPEQKLKLGWRLSDIRGGGAAESIFDDLYRHHQTLPSLGDFAKHLAGSFSKQGDMQKAKRYQQLSKTLA